MRKYKYLVGFVSDNQVVYGKDQYDDRFKTDIASYTQPMTILQAIRQLKTLRGKKVIYKLVAVDVEKEKVKQKTPKP